MTNLEDGNLTHDNADILSVENQKIPAEKVDLSNTMSKVFGGVPLSYDGVYNVPNLGEKQKLTAKKGVTNFKSLIVFPDGTKTEEITHKETYYSEKRLPGKGLNIPGRHTVKEDGTVRDGDGFIVIAAPKPKKHKKDPYPMGTMVMTTLGPGKVYDRGGMNGPHFDIYTNWG